MSVVCCLLGGCQPTSNAELTPSEARRPPSRPLKVIVSGDTRGWLVPCGCTSNQSGGLLRRASYVDSQRTSHDLVLLDAGGATHGTSLYDRLRFDAILRGERAMGVAAHNLGDGEFALGVQTLRPMQADLPAPFLSANAADSSGRPFTPGSRLIERNGEAPLLVVGVTSATSATDEMRVSDPAAAALREWDQHRASHPRLVVLAWMPESELRELARQLPEADVIIGGFRGQALAPEKLGRTWIAMAANKGKFLIEMTLADGEWSGRAVEVSADLADHPEQLQILARFRSELELRDVPATDTSFIPERWRQVPDDHRVAGSESCKDCHAADWDVWAASGHAHAWQTLVEQQAHVDAACQACHATGFGMPQGFVSAKRSPLRIDVGCESCHGPSERHAQDAAIRTPFRAADQCVICHDAENSPHFEYAAYWDRIRHGARDTQEAAR